MSCTIEVPQKIFGLTIFIVAQLVLGAIVILGNEYDVIFITYGIITLFFVDLFITIIFKRFGKIRVDATEEWIVVDGVKFARRDIAECCLSDNRKYLLISFNKPPFLPLLWRLANFARIEEWRPERMRSRSAAKHIIFVPLNRALLTKQVLIDCLPQGAVTDSSKT